MNGEQTFRGSAKKEITLDAVFFSQRTKSLPLNRGNDKSSNLYFSIKHVLNPKNPYKFKNLKGVTPSPTTGSKLSKHPQRGDVKKPVFHAYVPINQNLVSSI